MSDQALQESITQARAQTRNAILCANHQWEAIVEDLLGRLGIAQKALEAKENHISLSAAPPPTSSRQPSDSPLRPLNGVQQATPSPAQSKSTPKPDDDLQARYDDLLSKHEALQAQYAREAEGWKAFKKWWQNSVEKNKQRASASKSSRSRPLSFKPAMSGMEGDDPGPSTLRMPVTPAGQVSTPTKRKVDLSKEELDLFERVGIDPGPLQRTQPRERPARRLSGNEGKQDDSSTKRRRVEGDLGETSSAETSKQKSVTQNVHPSRSSGDDDTPDPSPALLLDTFSKQHVLANSATSANLDTREMSRPGTAQSQRQRATQVSQTIQDTPTTPITRRFPPAPSNGIQGPATEPSKRAHNDKSAEDQRQKQKQEPVTDPVPRTRRQEPASAAYADSPLEQGRLQRRVPGTDATKMLAPTSDRKSKGKARAYPDTAAEAGLSEASDGRDPADRTGEENERVAGGSEASRNRARIRETRQKEMAELKANPLKYKGRGRYAASMPKPDDKTINQEFEIDPEQNFGVGYQFSEVVRDRAQRKRMHAFDCECCKGYWENVGPLPPRAGPIWRTPSPPPLHARGGGSSRPATSTRDIKSTLKAEGLELGSQDGDKFRAMLERTRAEQEADKEAEREWHAAQVQAAKQLTSRHRDFGPQAETPPGYWTIGFPTTQHAQEINRQAEEERKRKREQIEKDNRYRVRGDPSGRLA